MIHYTCDRCRREIDTDIEVRYCVEVQINAVFENEAEPELDPDADNLLELDEMLERCEDEEDGPPQAHNHCCQHFDLCGECYKVYSRNPLARDFSASIQFSEN